MLDFLKLNYPNLYFLSLMRDFRETWLGWRQVVLRRNSNENMNLYLSKSAISWYSRYVNLYNRIINNEFKNVKIVDLNKLHSLENEGMKRICYFLNIEYCDIILNSTFGGKAWIGNASDEKNEKGLNKERAKYQWSLKLSSYDIEMLSIIFNDINFAFGYEIVNFNSNFKQKVAYSRFVLFQLMNILCS